MSGNDTNTKLYLPMSGQDGDVVFVDRSAGGANHLIQSTYGAQLSSDQAQFGAVSLQLNGGGARLEVRPNQGFRFGAGDFCIDFWMYLVSPEQCHVLSWYRDDDNYLAIETIQVNGMRQRLQSRFVRGGIEKFTCTMPAFRELTNAWTHVTLERSGTTISMYFNGALRAVETVDASVEISPNAWPLYIGAAPRPSATGLQRFHGFIDCFRISDVARFGGSFTPPTSEYTGRQSRSIGGSFAVRANTRHTVGGEYSVLYRRRKLLAGGSFRAKSAFTHSVGGAFNVRRSQSNSVGGLFNVEVRRYRQVFGGTYRIRQPRTVSLGGTFAVRSGRYSRSLGGRFDVRGRSKASIGGTFRAKRRYSISLAGRYSVENTNLEGVLVYSKVGADPNPEVDIPQVFSGLPISNLVLNQQEGVHHILVQRRNRYGLRSENLITAFVELDSGFAPVTRKPTGPRGASLTAAAGGTVTVEARYIRGADKSTLEDRRADTWHIYLRSDGTDPDPSADTPTVIAMTSADGIPRLSWTSAAFANGATIKVIVRTVRSSDGRDDGNLDIMTATATADGPAAPNIKLTAVADGLPVSV
ncbi:MAG: LamG domain-containing protein [Phycisphaerae bacterium]